jgi:hypothetical protein
VGTGWRIDDGRLRAEATTTRQEVSTALSLDETTISSRRPTWESGLAVIDRVPTRGDEPGDAAPIAIVSVMVGAVVATVDDGRRLSVGVRSHGFDFVGHGCERESCRDIEVEV